MPFPGSGGGPNSGPGLNTVLQYATPTGNDNNDGLTWSSAKKTADACLAYLVNKGGGEFHYETGVVGNIWLRGDGLSVPGFYNQMPLHVFGHGKDHSQFGDPMAGLVGGSFFGGNRLTPLIWLVKCSAAPIVIENVQPYNGVANQTFRAWDYKRYSNGSIAWANITSWQRTAGGDDGSADLTVVLPTATPMVSAVRTGSTVRVTWASKLPLPADVSCISAAKAQYVYINSTDPAYASGSFKVTAIDLSGSETLWFEYTDASSGSTTPMSPLGSYQSSGITVDDRVEVTSTNIEVPTCAYKVTACTDATHFTVKDVYGYAPRSTTGTFTTGALQYVLQDRSGWYASGLWTLKNCAGASTTVGTDRFINGPSVDLGGSSDGRVIFDGTSFTGMASTAIHCHDPDRACWMLLDGGALGACSATLRNDRPNGGGIRLYGSNTATWGIVASNVQGDIGADELTAPSAVTVPVGYGNGFGIIYLDNVTTADAPATIPNVSLDPACIGSRISIYNCGLVDAPGYVTGGTIWADKIVSPQAKNQFGPWASNRIAGATAGNFRTLGGLNSARYLNKVTAEGSWSLDGCTKTDGQLDPFGGTGAIKLAGSNKNPSMYNVTQTFTVGDKWVFGMWMRRVGGLIGSGYLASIGISPSLAGWTATNVGPFIGDGEWQWIFCFDTVPSTQINTTVNAAIGVADELYIYQPVLIKVPAADMTANEFAEFCETLRSQPLYLPAGMDGTGNGRKFIGHGGFGTDSANAKVAGVASGQLTLTGTGTVYLPMYDVDGTTIIGWIAQLQATINP